MVQTPVASFSIDFYVSQAIRDAFQHLNLGVTPFSKAVGGPFVKVVENRLAPML